MANKKNPEVDALVRADSLINTALSAVTEALVKGDLKKYGKARTKLDENVANYNKIAEERAFEACGDSVDKFIKTFKVDLKKVTEKTKKDEKGKATKVVESVSVDDKKADLNLGKFLRKTDRKDALSENAELLKLMEARQKDIFAMTPVEYKAEFKEADDFTKEIYKEILAGKTPTSNNQVAKKITEFLNACDVKRRGTSADIDFIERTLFSLDKSKKCAIKGPKTPAGLLPIMMRVLNHHITGAPYEFSEREEKK